MASLRATSIFVGLVLLPQASVAATLTSNQASDRFLRSEVDQAAQVVVRVPAVIAKGVVNGNKVVGKDPPQSEQFFEFDVLGDLTNVRECIVNAAILCHSLGLTLVLPSSYKSTYRSINLSEVYDLDQFDAGLKKVGIPVVRKLPAGAVRHTLSIPSAIDKSHRFQQVVDVFKPSVDSHKDELASFYAAGTSDALNIGFHVFESRNVSACKKDMPICARIQQSLVHSQLIRDEASKIVDAMNAKSPDWTALHLHDFQAFLCDQSTDKEMFFADKLLKAAGWKPGPLYLVSGRKDAKEAAASLKGWELWDKQSLMGTSSFEFQYGAAVDFEVALKAPHYVGKGGSSFDTFAIELKEDAGLKSGSVLYLPTNWGGCAENLEKEIASLDLPPL